MQKITKNTEQSKIEQKLFNDSLAKTEKSEEILFEQYKLYVELMDKVSERRHGANSFFLTVNTAIITASTGFITLIGQNKPNFIWIIIAATAGVVFCLTWRRLIHSYSQLNGGKFKIIHLLEDRLPARLFDAEWDALGRGDGRIYRPFTQTELNIPFVFAALYGVLAFLALIQAMFGPI